MLNSTEGPINECGALNGTTPPRADGPLASLPDTPEAYTGACFCGAVSIEVTGVPEEMGYCHCSSCRSYSGAPFVAFTLWKAENVRVTKGQELIGTFNKSGFSDRQFCTKCGGHLMTGHPGLGFTDVYAAAIPDLPFKPSVHLNYAEAVLPIRDGVPKLKDFPAHAGGSGQVVPEIWS